MPVYTHLKYTPAELIEMPKMPETLRQCKKMQQSELAGDDWFADDSPSYADDASSKFDGSSMK